MTSIITPYLKAQGISLKRGQKECKTQRMGNSTIKSCPLHMLYRCCTHVNPLKLQCAIQYLHNKKFQHDVWGMYYWVTIFTWRANDTWWFPEKGESLLFWVWPILYYKCQTGWPNTHEVMDSINWTQWIIK